MQVTALGKGTNAVLVTATVTATVDGRGVPQDVSALLLGPGGKVRSDDDLVFYNYPKQDGVSVSGHTVTVDLPRGSR